MTTPGTPRLLTGGNPQIPKGYGDGAVQAWLDAVPGWKQAPARRIDALVTATLPGVEKAVKWNQPFYGVETGRWFMAMHILTRYIKVAWFNGSDLDPPPEVTSKVAGVRYWHLHEDDEIDEDRLASWITQASTLPGSKM